MTAMQTQTLKQEIEKFRKSNIFTPGDPTSFSVKLNDEFTLPGKYDPVGWLDGYGVDARGNVAVICAANGGLAVELSRRGAVTVTTFEPRSQYFAALDAITKFYVAAGGKPITVIRSMPKSPSPTYDTIVWSEGLEQLRDPILPLKEALACLAPGGKLYIEVIHGTNGPCPAKINSWKPTPQGFEETIKALPDVKVAATKKGRKDLRTVYIIESTKPAVPQAIAEELKKDPAGPVAEIAAEPAVVTPKKAANQPKPKPKQDPSPAPAPAPSAETVKPKRVRRSKAAPKAPETPPGPATPPL
jgi:hypothetical protein